MRSPPRPHNYQINSVSSGLARDYLAGVITGPQLAFPDLTSRYGGPQIAYEILGMVTGVDDAMVLTQQLFSRIFRDAAKLIVDVVNDSALISNRHNRRLVERKLNIGELFKRTLQRIVPLWANITLSSKSTRRNRKPS